MRKIKFGRQWLDGHHRSGWPYAVNSLRPLHDDRGVLLDGFIEKKFAWGRDPGDRYNEFRPYAEPWVGFLHNPPNIPEWYDLNQHSPQEILETPYWKESIVYCQGLFTLSDYLKKWLEPRVPVPVSTLLHPTETPALGFSMKAYRANRERMVVQIGWWLRKFHSLYQLPVTRLRKAQLNIGFDWIDKILERELEFVEPPLRDSVRVIHYLPNEQYDELLSQNLVFLHLYDSSANNALIECIVRSTPVLVNPLEAVVEYLGPDYPFYFDTLGEAAAKAEDEEAVAAAHEYLKALPIKRRLTREHFRQSFQESRVYRALKPPPPLVSIITSLFAADRYVEAFLKNITAQTVFDRCELLLFDVPSSHEDPRRVEETVREYAERHPNIVYRRIEEDPGLYELWNTEIRMSRGKYIAMACIDDSKSPDSLEQQLLALEAHPEVDVACCAVLGTKTPYETWESNTAYRTFCGSFNWQNQNLSSSGSEERFGMADLFYKDESGQWLDSDNLPHCMPMWRKSLHDKHGYFDEKQFGPLADWEFWLRCASRGAGFILLRKTLGLYLENPQSHNRRTPSDEIKKRIIGMYREKYDGG